MSNVADTKTIDERVGEIVKEVLRLTKPATNPRDTPGELHAYMKRVVLESAARRASAARDQDVEAAIASQTRTMLERAKVRYEPSRDAQWMATTTFDHSPGLADVRGKGETPRAALRALADTLADWWNQPLPVKQP